MSIQPKSRTAPFSRPFTTITTNRSKAFVFLFICTWFVTSWWLGSLDESLSPSFPSQICNPEQAALNAMYFHEQGYDSSSCPEDAWLDALRREHHASQENLLFINIGVNKGYNILRWLNVWRPDISICPADWFAALVETGGNVDGFCGVCGECRAPCPIQSSEGHSKNHTPNLTIIGIDASAATIDMLAQVLRKLDIVRSRGIHTELIIGAGGETNGNVLLQSDCQDKGNEHCAIQQNPANLDNAIPVPMFSVDRLHEASPSVAGLLASHRGPIDILHIDTEGYDPNVIKGALGTLRYPGVRLLSFEYHEIGLWATVSLKAVTLRLDRLGYDCWFQGRKRLFRITGCYVPQLEIKKWSNVLCTRRTDPFYAALAALEYVSVKNSSSIDAI